ncbi:hypothetical protein G7047_09640 [Diaphorobacter sp. HDW4A]|uniref:hypothetical protein n=1 Tax=Diaphorobacter sp. HDW4A TaxID=2714924 RepID=UPI001408F305|nr:hypothetical protein [Diaphorobacter sp. HDW4A]QIL80137.1 hypothetical protein G7047_09640 [Diaphorobacter sp. HDW4A]
MWICSVTVTGSAVSVPVSREDFDTLNVNAKRMGGSYSSFRGSDAVPGFQFRTREAADAFGKLVAGDAEQARQIAQDRRSVFEDDKSQPSIKPPA